MIDRVGNSLEFTANGIIHTNSGKSVKFFRDAAGRITSIYDPNGLNSAGQTNGPPALQYKYDGNGNLIAAHRLTNRNATNPAYLTTTFGYENAKYPWPKSDDERDSVRCNYMYYPQSDQPAKKSPRPGEEEWSLVAEKAGQLVSQRSMVTDLIYTIRTRPHSTAKNPTGINTLWGDGHVSFSTSKRAFDPKLWNPPGDDYGGLQNPGDNPKNFQTIVSLLRP